MMNPEEFRQGDRGNVVSFMRTDRFTRNENGTYQYKTREGEIRGPFATRADAKYDLNAFIQTAQLKKEFQDQTFQYVA